MIYTTDWLYIDTDEFETAEDVKVTISELDLEMSSLCDDCPDCRKCGFEGLCAGVDGCLRMDDCEPLFEIIGALRKIQKELAAEAAA